MTTQPERRAVPKAGAAIVGAAVLQTLQAMIAFVKTRGAERHAQR